METLRGSTVQSRRHRDAGRQERLGPVPREGEDPLAGMMDYMGAQGDDFLDHRFDATALGRMAGGGIGSQQGMLADQAQEVIGHGAQGQD